MKTASMPEDNGLALALAALAGCDVVDVIHDLDGTDSGACAPDCSGCSMEFAPAAAPWCQWCGEDGHALAHCADLAARLMQDGGAR